MWKGTFWFPVQCSWPCWMTWMDAFIFHYNVVVLVRSLCRRTHKTIVASCSYMQVNRALFVGSMKVMIMLCLALQWWSCLWLVSTGQEWYWHSLSVWSYLLYLVTVVHMTGSGIKNWLWRVRKWPQICATDSQACLSARMDSNPVWLDSLRGLFEVISSAFKTVLPEVKCWVCLHDIIITMAIN